MGTSFTSPGCIPSRALRISSILGSMRGHRFAPRTIIAKLRRSRFCWCGMFLSAVITTSYPASSARSRMRHCPALPTRAPPPRRCHDRRGDVEAAGVYCGQTGFACETMATLASRSCTTNSKTVRTCASSPSNHSTKSWTVAALRQVAEKGGHGQPGAGKHPGSR